MHVWWALSCLRVAGRLGSLTTIIVVSAVPTLRPCFAARDGVECLSAVRANVHSREFSPRPHLGFTSNKKAKGRNELLSIT